MFASVLFAGPLRAQFPDAPVRLDSGRFSFLAYPSDEGLARSLLIVALANDTFPGMPRPKLNAVIAIAPDERRFRSWTGPNAPEWGAAVAFPERRIIVMQGGRSGSDAGDPRTVLRHELAHLALSEFMGPLPPRWFDEGYASFAAGEWQRGNVLATNFLLLLRGVPSLDSLDLAFQSGASRAQAAYALAHHAVAELAAMDDARGLQLFLGYWKATASLERAMRQAYGVTLDDFQKEWKRSMRVRYGVIALFADLSLVGVGVLFLFVPLYMVRRQRIKERLELLKAKEARVEEALRVAAESEAFRALVEGPSSNLNVSGTDTKAPQ